MRVLEVVGNNSFPLSAKDIFNTLERNTGINRVTVYRILDLLVAHGVVDRLSTGGRACYYGLAPNEIPQTSSPFLLHRMRTDGLFKSGKSYD